MNSNEKFIFNRNELDFGILDFWKSKYSNIYNLQEVIAEFIVEKALGIDKAQNTDYWTLYDILYRDYRIEVKETGYYHPWNENGKVSKQRMFSITKANSNYETNEKENKFERQNDIYVFCLNTGMTKETSNPMKLDNWEFYIIPTSEINKQCGDNKKISLERIRKITEKKNFDEIKSCIDRIINDKIKVANNE